LPHFPLPIHHLPTFPYEDFHEVVVESDGVGIVRDGVSGPLVGRLLRVPLCAKDGKLLVLDGGDVRGAFVVIIQRQDVVIFVYI